MERSIVGGRYCTCRQMNFIESLSATLMTSCLGLECRHLLWCSEQAGVYKGRRTGVPLIVGKVLEDAYKLTEGLDSGFQTDGHRDPTQQIEILRGMRARVVRFGRQRKATALPHVYLGARGI